MTNDAATAPTFRWSGGRFGGLLTALVFAVSLTWVVGMPLFTSPDEPAHLFKAYGVAHGEVLGSPMADEPSNIRLFDVPTWMGTPNLECYFRLQDVSAGCAKGAYPVMKSTAAVYPPPWYLVVGGTARAVGQSTHQRAYRAAAAAVAAAVLAAALVVARRSRAGAWSPLLLVTFTPMAWFMSGGVNPSSFQTAAFVFLWATVLHVGVQGRPSRRAGVAVGAAAAASMLAHYLSVVWVVVCAAIALVMIGRRAASSLWNKRFLVPALGLPALAAVYLAVWSRYASVNARDRSVTQPDRWKALSDTVHNLPMLGRQLLGVLGWLDTPLPGEVYAVLIALLVLVLAGVLRSRERRLLVSIAVIIVVSVATALAINVATAASAGLIWQGRYWLPVFPAVAVAGMLGWQRVGLAVRRRRQFLGVLGAALVAVEVVAFWQALRRFCVGLRGTWWLVGDLGWRPDVAPMLLVAANAAAMALLVAAVVYGSEPTGAAAPQR